MMSWMGIGLLICLIISTEGDNAGMMAALKGQDQANFYKESTEHRRKKAKTNRKMRRSEKREKTR